jgi:hypothetical protein
MDRRSKTIVTVGVTAIILSLAAFVVLYSENDHRITFVTDPDGIADLFAVIDEDTGVLSALEKGVKVGDKTTIRSDTDEIVWAEKLKKENEHTVVIECYYKGELRTFVLWVNGADLTSAEVLDGVFYVHVTDIHYNFAVSISLHDARPE